MPAKFIRQMAGFQKEEGSYVLPRAGYEPPASLQRQIWPWLEGWLARVQARVQGKGWKAGGLAQADKAAENFLKLLGVLRSVLLQDLAVLQPIYPNLPFFQQPVFQHPDWQPFASAVQLADTSLAVQQQQATLLQQVLPQVSAAIYNSRDALLQQGARINAAVETTLDGRLAKLEGSVNCLINSQLGAAQLLLAGQLNAAGPGAAQPVAGQIQLPPFTLALQPAAAEPTTRPAGPPAYNFISARTVGDVWREYKEGIAGGPAVEELERQWQARWRLTTA
jgi:hypothetical protein